VSDRAKLAYLAAPTCLILGAGALAIFWSEHGTSPALILGLVAGALAVALMAVWVHKRLAEPTGARRAREAVVAGARWRREHSGRIIGLAALVAIVLLAFAGAFGSVKAFGAGAGCVVLMGAAPIAWMIARAAA